jgi:histidyl-tRNA synthetase
MKLENVKGTYDYSKKEQELREYIKDTLKKIFKKYGYSPLETPLVCYFDLLTLKYDENDEILQEIFKLSDRGERKLGLRYDLTVPFAKFIAMKKDLKLPFKRYEIGEAFRDGPVKRGRDRQFVQCDIDVVGLDGQVVEAELLSLFITGYNELKIPVEIRYNSRKLMKGIIESLNINSNISAVIKIIDKIEKISKEDLKQELSNLGINDNTKKLLLKYFIMDFNNINNEFKSSTNINIIEGLSELKCLNELLNFQNLTKYMRFVPSLVRGQEYYTGNVFEAYATESDLNCSIGGGGRYDKMITDWICDGNSYPAVGLSFGLSVIYELLKDKEEFKNKSIVDIYIIPMDTYKESLKIADSIRDLGLNVEVEMKSQKVKKSLEYANRENIPYIIILGENELKENNFKLKDMENGTEVTISLNDLNEIKNVIKIYQPFR